MASRRLPGLAISETDYELLRAFAHEHRINGISEAVRHILRTSSHLQAYAQTKGIQCEFAPRPWGGARRRRQ